MPHDSPRRYLHLALTPMPVRAVDGMRSPTPADEHRIASLMYHAYIGTIDYHGEDEAQALDEVRSTFSGKYGAFMWSASRVIERDSILTSAALLTRWQDRPFIAFSMTRPEFQHRGFARACLMSAVNQLLADGEHEVRLVATLANVAAMGLYQNLGFLVQQ